MTDNDVAKAGIEAMEAKTEGDFLRSKLKTEKTKTPTKSPVVKKSATSKALAKKIKAESAGIGSTRRTEIVKAVQKAGATSQTKAVTLQDLYKKVKIDPRIVRVECRNLRETGHLKTAKLEGQGLSVYIGRAIDLTKAPFA